MRRWSLMKRNQFGIFFRNFFLCFGYPEIIGKQMRYLRNKSETKRGEWHTLKLHYSQSTINPQLSHILTIWPMFIFISVLKLNLHRQTNRKTDIIRYRWNTHVCIIINKKVEPFFYPCLKVEQAKVAQLWGDGKIAEEGHYVICS